jgi:hypothetical protein
MAAREHFDAFAERVDGTDDLVTENARKRTRRKFTVGDVQVRSTHCTRVNANGDLATSRRAARDVRQAERRPWSVEQHSAHAWSMAPASERGHDGAQVSDL